VSFDVIEGDRKLDTSLRWVRFAEAAGRGAREGQAHSTFT
jgi:hypothetical protein